MIHERDPRSEYLLRLTRHREALARHNRTHVLLANVRLLVFVAGAGVAWKVFHSAVLSLWWLAPPVLLFVVLAAVHAATLRARTRRAAFVSHYEQGLRRLEGDWAGKGDGGKDLFAEDHLYAHSLNLCGTGSIFELLCIAQTGAGRQTLANLLASEADAETIRSRQAAVVELAPNLDLREELIVCRHPLRTIVDWNTLLEWSRAPSSLNLPLLRRAVWALLATAVLSLGVGLALHSAAPSIVVLALSGGLVAALKRRLKSVARKAEEPLRELGAMGRILVLLEKQSFHGALLTELQRALRHAGKPASKQTDQLERLNYLYESLQRNAMPIVIIFVVLMAGEYNLFALLLTLFLLAKIAIPVAMETWRTDRRADIPRWLEGVGTFEALSCLAAYAFEHPRDILPEILEGPARIEAIGLGHPLLPEAKCVRNDLALGNEVRLLVVSGSNMSGKTTLLRTLGVNVVLARAGAPVRAGQLRLTPLTLGATLDVHDSIQGGVSRFYAEILRLKQVVDANMNPYPVLFLFDELLHGTNSHDRYTGAAAMARELIEQGAIGLITTHDLALTKIPELLGASAANVHFASRMCDGRLQFDYTMRPGVVCESNAIALMRSVGLPLGEA